MSFPDDIRIEALSHNDLTPLYLACCHTSESHRKVVELLLTAGADPNMVRASIPAQPAWVVPLHKGQLACGASGQYYSSYTSCILNSMLPLILSALLG